MRVTRKDSRKSKEREGNRMRKKEERVRNSRKEVRRTEKERERCSREGSRVRERVVWRALVAFHSLYQVLYQMSS